MDSLKPTKTSCRLCGTPVVERAAFCPQCGASAPDARTADDPVVADLHALFRGELRIDRELGRGAMAVVYAAHDIALDRRVAVKTLRPEMGDNPDFLERFQREARTVAALQHQNIVAIHGVRSAGAITAIVMQLIDGRALDAVLEEHSPLPTGVAGLVLAQVAAGLSHAHERGIVHRDIKPGNVLLSYNGLAVVSDFGIARRDGVARVTSSGVILGTVAYMSPEQVTGAVAEPSSDQYSFGVMAYELLSGQLPFRGSIAQIMFAHLNTVPRHLRELRPDLPADVCAYVMRCLDKEPRARHASLREARRVFLTLVPDEAVATTHIMSISQVQAGRRTRDQSAPSPEIDGALHPLGEQPPPSTSPAEEVRRPSRATRIGVALVAVGVAAALVWVLGPWGSRSADQKHAPPRQDALGANAGHETPGPIARDAARGARTSADANGAVQSGEPRGATRRDPSPTTPIETTKAAASLTPTSTPAVPPTTPVRDSAPPASSVAAETTGRAAERPDAQPSSPRVATATASLADARAGARAFVTACNQRRWRDLDALQALGGDAAVRAEIIRLVRDAPDFAAGFDRVASSPVLTSDGFMTEFVLELTWRGGRRLAAIQLHMTSTSGTWQPAAFSASRTE